ncbi:hypothetical protein RvY_06288-2 [Ramazzottius varieornatus]|uniref:BTB domain-containing protein n=1 Tax=Ramazzottius varieornatus TaxID=947166 RepID=A0A1D1V3I9_RAMVA|nr:hypothetical protein RvY_06288-2 [Ramazzottius varieornatus]
MDVSMEEDNFEPFAVEREFFKVFWNGQESLKDMAEDSEIRQWLRSLLDDKELEQYKDVIFLCCGLDGHERTVRAHRLVLTTKSRTFADMLASHNDPAEPVRITGVDADVFETIIHYIYTGQITTPQRVVQTVELLYAANKYDIAPLSQLVKHFLECRLAHLNTKHFIMITQRVLDLQMDDLTTMCFTLVEQRTALVVQEPVFLRVSPEFIRRVLQLDSFAGIGENQVFARVLEWAVMRAGGQPDGLNQEGRPNESEFHLARPHVRQVLEPFIRDFRLVSVPKDDLAALVKNSGVFTEREQLTVSYYLLDQTKDLGEFTMKERHFTTV